MSKIWIGRVKDNSVLNTRFPRRYADTVIPARRIEWLSSFPENTVSTTLSAGLRQQHPFTLLEKSVHLEVFSLAFGSFVHGDRHAATVYNDDADFLDSDAALLGIISRLASAACMAVDEGKSSLTASDLADILLRSPPIQYTCTQEADIHSPGFNRYISVSAVSLVIGAVAAGLLGLALYSSKDKLAADIPSLTVINTSPDADPQCTARVSKASAMVLKALGIDRTWALCEAAKAAQKRTGLRPSAKPTPSKN